MSKCPHCGNTNPKTIESNGVSGADCVLLCVRLVAPDFAAVLVHGFDPKTDTDANGLVPCGMQWPDEEASKPKTPALNSHAAYEARKAARQVAAKKGRG